MPHIISQEHSTLQQLVHTSKFLEYVYIKLKKLNIYTSYSSHQPQKVTAHIFYLAYILVEL